MMIDIIWDKNNLPLIQTSNLTLRPIQEGDLPDYLALFTHPKAMAMYLTGQPRSEEWIKDRVSKWVERWKMHPFSAFHISQRVNKLFVGHVVLGHGDYEGNPHHGWSEVGLVTHPSMWANGFGQEIAKAIYAFALELFKRGEKVPVDVLESQIPEIEKLCLPKEDLFLDSTGKMIAMKIPFKEIRATCHVDNVAMVTILNGFMKIPGATRDDERPDKRHLFKLKLTS